MSMKATCMTWYLCVSLTSAIGFMLPATPGWGQEAGGRLGLLLEALDQNQDGRISREEFPGSDEQFTRLDANGDGYATVEDIQATAAEVKQQVQTRVSEEFAKHDTNQDGMLSREEFPGSDEQFARVDADGDGQLTPEEFKAAAETARQERGRRRLRRKSQ